MGSQGGTLSRECVCGELLGRGGGPRSSCALSSWAYSWPGSPRVQDGGGEAARPLESWASELVSCHFRHMLLVKASHKTNPDATGEEELQKLEAVGNLPLGFGGGRLSQQARRGVGRERALWAEAKRSVWD